MAQESLDEYLQYGSENNAELQARFKEYQAALEAIPQAKSLPDPLFSFGYFVSPVETRVGPQQAKFGLTQMLPWFGALNARGSASEAMAQVKYENFIKARNSYFLKVRVNYFKLYEIQQGIRINIENLDILRSWENLALKKYEGGLTGMVDVLRVQMTIAELESSLQNQEKEFDNQSEVFNLLLNRDAGEKVNVDHQLLYPDMEYVISQDSLVNNPAFAILSARKEVERKMIEVEQKNTMPNIGLGLDYVLVGPSTIDIPESGKNVLMPMVSFSLPIYRKKNSSKIHERELNLEALELYQNNLGNQLRSDLGTWINAYDDSKRDHLLYTELIEKADQALRVLVTEYTSANKDFDEVLKMQQLLLKYELALEKSIADRYISEAQLDYLFNR